MSLKSEMEDAAVEILAQVGEPVEWLCQSGGSLSVQGIVSPSDDKIGGLGIGGFQSDYEFSVKVLQSSFPSVQPSPLDMIRLDGSTYLIQEVQKSRVGPFYIFKIGTP